MQTTVSKKKLYQSLVNAPFADKILATTIDLGIVVLLLVNKAAGTIDRIALSQTEMAKKAVQVSAKPFEKIQIPLDAEENIISQAINSGNMTQTSDWYELFAPVFTPKQARLNQHNASIECSFVHPIGNQQGALIFSFYQPLENITETHRKFIKRFARLVEKRLQTA